MNEGYPLMLRLEGRRCVVVGGGVAGAHKVAGLLAAGAHVTVISSALHPDLQKLADEAKIEVELSAYQTSQLANLRPLLVFAATDDAALNQQIATDARAIGALVDRLDAGYEGDFTALSTLRRGSITVGISTGGASPALAAHLRQRIEGVVGEEYTTLAAWMGAARSSMRERFAKQSQRAAIWRQVIESTVLDDLRRGDEATAREVFDQLVSGGSS